MQSAHRRVDLHELAEGFVRGGARRHFDTLPHLYQRLVVLLGPAHIPAALEDRERLGLVGNVHFLRAQRQRHVGGTGAQALHCQVEGGTARGAGVLDVVDRDSLDADLTEHDLAGNGYLALQGTVGHARIKATPRSAPVAARIHECGAQRLPGQVFQAALQSGDRTRSWRYRRYTRYPWNTYSLRLFVRCPASTAHAGPFSAPCQQCCAAARQRSRPFSAPSRCPASACTGR